MQQEDMGLPAIKNTQNFSRQIKKRHRSPYKAAMALRALCDGNPPGENPNFPRMGQVWVWRSGTANFKDRKGGQFLPCGTTVWVKINFKIQNFKAAKSLDFLQNQGFSWSWMSDLNRRPHDYESGALPTELIQRILFSGHLNRGGLTVTNQALYQLS